MKKLSKKYNYNRQIPKLAMGGSWGTSGQANAQAIAGFAGMTAPLLGEGSRGAGALSGAATGAGMGAALGPIGMGVGAVLGGTMGLISAGQQKKQTQRLANDQAMANSKAYSQQFNSQLDTINQNPYGNMPMFEMGGNVGKYEDGGNISNQNKKVGGLFDTNKTAYVDSVLNSNQNLEWVKRLKDNSSGSIQVKGEKYRSTHLMSDDGNGYIFPRIIGNNGKLTDLGSEDAAYDYAKKNNTGIQLPQQQGSWFAANGYKTGTGVLNSINNKQIPFNNPNYVMPKFADGGELTGPGDDVLYTTKKGNKITKNAFALAQKTDMPYARDGVAAHMNWVDGWAHPYEKDVVEVAGKAFQNSFNGKTNNYQETQGVNRSMNGGYSTYNISPAQNRAIDSTQFVKQYRFDNKIVSDEQNTANQLSKLKAMGAYGDGSEVTDNSNVINIEKGELQIDPQTGKILREYTGINPETGGLYEAHKVKGQDVKHNIVSAEENTFIITKAKAKEYKDATDNNDKLHLESIKMNIRNNKDAKMGTYKMGSYVKYDDGSLVNMPQYNDPLNTGQTILNQGINSLTQQKNNNLSNLFGTAAQYAPALMNTAKGMFGKVEQNPYIQSQVNPFQNQTLNNMPNEISSQPIIDGMYGDLKSQFNTIDNNTSGSAISRANKNSEFARFQNQIPGVRMNAQINNNAIKTQRGSIYNQLGQQQVANNQYADQRNFQIDQINAQNRGAKQNLLSTGLGQLQQTYQNNQHNNELTNSDNYKVQLLKEMFPNLNFYDNLYGNKNLPNRR